MCYSAAMRFPLLLLTVLLTACSFFTHTPAKNPDPNHTHADFAVWIEGKKLDFSDEKYMSGSSSEEHGEVHEHEHRHPYFHLHDGIGHVIHMHKPGLHLLDFFVSLGFGTASEKNGEYCWYTSSADHPFTQCESGPMRLFVNGKKYESDDPIWGGDPLIYVFNDGDHLLFTDATSDAEIARELSQLTDDACRYSQTCPWKGKPPTENCIADPTVPCVAPVE